MTLAPVTLTGPTYRDTKICGAPTCISIMLVGEGRGGSKATCSDACRKRASRGGGVMTVEQKVHEIDCLIQDLRDMINDHPQQTADYLQYLERAFHVSAVARRLWWNELHDKVTGRRVNSGA